LIEETARSGQCRDRGNGDVVPEDQRSGSGPTAAAIDNDVVRGGIEGEGDVVFDVLGGELEADRDPSGHLADAVGETLEVVARVQVRERRRRDRGGAFGQPANLGDLALDLAPREM